ncbi:MAG: signal peptidase I [Clostridia bacterium]|nr:signal peptidase I [Clostridia bacterium]
MLEKLKKIKENKVLKFIVNVLYTLMFIVVVLLLLVVVMQRVSDNTITLGGFRMFTVATGSMVPVYDVGDILIAKEIKPEKIKVGDDLVYLGKKGTFAGKIVTHRVNSIEKQEDGNYKIITQGVANNAADPEISQTQVLGKVMCEIHILSFMQKMMKNVYVFYFVIFIPVGILVYKNVKSIINVDNEEENDEEDNKDN